MKVNKKSINYLGIAFVILLIGVFAYSGYEYYPKLIGKGNQALLEGNIHISKANTTEGSERVAPGSHVTLSATIKNLGTAASAPGEVAIRFAFLKPMDTHAKSIIFQTEKAELPSILPHQQVTVAFKTPHQWPSLPDFIRQDWPLRQYQIVVMIDQEDVVIGSKAIAYSAYYYEGPEHDMPSPVPSVAENTTPPAP